MADQSGLDVLLKTEQTCPPPEDFRKASEFNDPEIYARADADPEAWWAGWAEKLDWIEPWDTVLDWSDPPHATWFAGGKLNVSANCLDRHVAAGRGEDIAYHWEAEDAGPDDQPVTGVGSSAGGRISVTIGWLHDETQRLANVLRSRRGCKGDVVGIFMPIVPEAAVAMHDCT